MASNCKLIRAEIEENAGGAWLSRGAAAHLESCAGCLDFMNEREALRRLVGGLGRVEAPADFEFRLRARMAAAKEKRAARFAFLRPAPGLASLALAAALVTSVAAAYYFGRPAATVTTADQTTPHQATDRAQTAAQTSPPAETTAASDVVNKGDRQPGDAPPPNVERTAAFSPPRRVRRVTQARAASEPRTEAAQARPAGELEFGLSTSPVVKGTNVKLEVASEPLRVVLRDERGTPRRQTMRPVSFGAQNPVGKRREAAKTTVADSGGVW